MYIVELVRSVSVGFLGFLSRQFNLPDKALVFF